MFLNEENGENSRFLTQNINLMLLVKEKCATIRVTTFCQSHFEWSTFCAFLR